MKTKIAVIGGSGLYHIEGVRITARVDIPTPFGLPSDPVSICEIDGREVAFLPRHGRGHRLLPTEVPSRANIWALKSLGVEQILAVSAVGSLKEDLRPGDFVICDQLIDRTRNRPDTFFGNGIVGHVGFADPYCPRMRERIELVMREHEHPFHASGILVCMEGPLFSTRAESLLYRSWGADLIGMTALPEAKLAREAEICFALIAMVTDYDCWKEAEEDVNQEMVFKCMQDNSQSIKNMIPDLVKALASNEDCACRHAAQSAITTDTDLIQPDAKRRLALFYGKYWNEN